MNAFRLGATSYILPDEILPNVRYLVGKVRDVELVLFEVDHGPNNLPSAGALAELASLAEAHNLTYTVHLPLDLRLGAGGDPWHVSMRKANRVIECTRALDPWAYVLHLDGKDADDHPAWVRQAADALEIVAGWAGGPERLAVENLEGYPLDFFEPVLQRLPVGRCVDVGHLWLDGHDPVPYLRRALPRARVVHLHGVGSRDHQSLAHVAPGELRAVLECLVEARYTGVVTLEVFNEGDLLSSLEAVQRVARGSWESG